MPPELSVSCRETRIACRASQRVARASATTPALKAQAPRLAPERLLKDQSIPAVAVIPSRRVVVPTATLPGW